MVPRWPYKSQRCLLLPPLRLRNSATVPTTELRNLREGQTVTRRREDMLLDELSRLYRDRDKRRADMRRLRRTATKLEWLVLHVHAIAHTLPKDSDTRRELLTMTASVANSSTLITTKQRAHVD